MPIGLQNDYLIQAHTQQTLYYSGTLTMGCEAKKTEHCGPKRCIGAYWGYKWEARKASNRARRENGKREIRTFLTGSAPSEPRA